MEIDSSRVDVAQSMESRQSGSRSIFPFEELRSLPQQMRQMFDHLIPQMLSPFRQVVREELMNMRSQEQMAVSMPSPYSIIELLHVYKFRLSIIVIRAMALKSSSGRSTSSKIKFMSSEQRMTVY